MSIEADTDADTAAEFTSIPAVVLPQDISSEGSPTADHSSTGAESSGPWWCRMGVDWGSEQCV